MVYLPPFEKIIFFFHTPPFYPSAVGCVQVLLWMLLTHAVTDRACTHTQLPSGVYFPVEHSMLFSLCVAQWHLCH